MSTKSLVWSLPFFGRPAPGRTRVFTPQPLARRRNRFSGFSKHLRYYLVGLLIVSTAVLLVVYVFGINQSAAKGYEITKQRNKLNALVEENKKLMVRTAEAGSILQIQDEAASRNLVQITNQEYLQQTQLSQR